MLENLMNIIIDNAWPLALLGLLVVAVVFALLAAGVRIEIRSLCDLRPPAGRIGSFFLAVLGVLLMSFSLFNLYNEYSPGAAARGETPRRTETGEAPG